MKKKIYMKIFFWKNFFSICESELNNCKNIQKREEKLTFNKTKFQKKSPGKYSVEGFFLL